MIFYWTPRVKGRMHQWYFVFSVVYHSLLNLVFFTQNLWSSKYNVIFRCFNISNWKDQSSDYSIPVVWDEILSRFAGISVYPAIICEKFHSIKAGSLSCTALPGRNFPYNCWWNCNLNFCNFQVISPWTVTARVNLMKK